MKLRCVQPMHLHRSQRSRFVKTDDELTFFSIGTAVSQDLVADVHSHRAFSFKGIECELTYNLGKAWDSAGVKKNKFFVNISVCSFVSKNAVESLGPRVRVRELYTSKAHQFVVVLRIDETSMCTAHARVRAGPGSQRCFS